MEPCHVSVALHQFFLLFLPPCPAYDPDCLVLISLCLHGLMGDKRNERAREKMQALLITGMTWHRITTSPAFGQKNSKEMSGETIYQFCLQGQAVSSENDTDMWNKRTDADRELKDVARITRKNRVLTASWHGHSY